MRISGQAIKEMLAVIDKQKVDEKRDDEERTVTYILKGMTDDQLDQVKMFIKSFVGF